MAFTAFAVAVIGAVHHTRAETGCGWLNRLVPMAAHHLMHHPSDGQGNGNFGPSEDTLLTHDRAE
jgi:sterol desaturase/sphingolipid hydroxylase (fatty acid hydroxylase superfamily)